MKTGFDQRYSLVEPFRKSDGKVMVCALENKNTSEVVFDPFDSDGKDGNDHLRMMISAEAWTFPNDFTKLTDKDGNYVHPIEADIPALIKEISDEIESIIRENLYFVNERDYGLLATYILCTYFCEYFQYMPRLILVGTTNSGKNRLQKIIKALSYRGKMISNSSFSSAFRYADAFAPTMIMDETQDMSKDVRRDMMVMFKTGFEKDGTFTRVHPESLIPLTFKVYCPIALSVKTMNIDEDIRNRSFVINMIEAPRGRRLNKNFDPESERIQKARDQLYRIMFAVEQRRIYYLNNKGNSHFDLKEFISRCYEWLAAKDEFNNIPYPEESRIDDHYPELMNRQFDIAKTMFPFTYFNGHTDDLFQELIETDEKNKEVLRCTNSSSVINAWA